MNTISFSLLNIAFVLGQVLFGGYFLFAGLSHFRNMSGMTAYASAKGIPVPKLAVVVTGVMLVVGGLGIIVNIYSAIALALIILFLLGVTFVMHNFWSMPDSDQKMVQKLFFARNIGLLGASLMLFVLSFMI